MAKIPYPNGLAECMARVNITDPALATAAGTTKQQIHKLRHGERKLTVQWAKRLAPHLDCDWQELVEGPMDSVDVQRADLLSEFDAMDTRDRETLLRIARSIRQGDPPAADPPTPGKRRANGCVVRVARVSSRLRRI